MKEIIYLICSKQKVEGMRKRVTNVHRTEILVKLVVEVDPKAFGRPTIEKEIYIDDWTKGIDLEDVEFRKNIITGEEAELIKSKRIEKMREILEKQGYTITDPEP